MSVEFIGYITNNNSSETIVRNGPVLDRRHIETVAKAHENAGFDRALLAFHSTTPDGLQVGQHGRPALADALCHAAAGFEFVMGDGQPDHVVVFLDRERHPAVACGIGGLRSVRSAPLRLPKRTHARWRK